MKTIILATAATLTLAGSAIAGNFDGSISAADFAAKHFAATSYDEGDGPRGTVEIGGSDVNISSSNGNVAEFALRHFAQDYETGDGPRVVGQDGELNTVLSSKGGDLTAFAKAKLFNDRGDER